MPRKKKEVAAPKGQLPAAIADMATGLQQSTAMIDGGDTQFMKFTKFGSFEYGAENTETEEGAEFAVNPLGFGHGLIAWGDDAHNNEGEMLGEVMASASQPLPAMPDPVEGKWVEQRAMQMACISGEDEGLQVLFKSSSLGGKKFYAGVVMEVVKRINAGESDIVAVITLEADSYQHAKYGKIFTPTFTIVRWQGMDDTAPAANQEEAKEEAPATEKAPEPEAEKPTRRRRRRAA